MASRGGACEQLQYCDAWCHRRPSEDGRGHSGTDGPVPICGVLARPGGRSSETEFGIREQRDVIRSATNSQIWRCMSRVAWRLCSGSIHSKCIVASRRHLDMADDPLDSVRLSIFCPLRPDSSGTIAATSNKAPHIVDISSTKTIRDLKQRLEAEIEGKPSANGQTLIWRGRRLKDDETIGSIVAEVDAVSAA